MSDDRVSTTDEAVRLLRRLVAEHGPLMFHQSGGCCDGSAPMCYPKGEYRLGRRDVHLGDLAIGEGLEAVPVYISGEQFEVWRNTRLTIDVVQGRGSGFSLEGPTGYRFLTRSEVCAPD